MDSLSTKDNSTYTSAEDIYALQAAVKRYPFDQTARIKLVKCLYETHNNLFGEELRKASLYLPDRSVLFYLTEGDKYTIKPYASEEETQPEKDQGSSTPNETHADRTSTLINNFLMENPDDQPKRKLSLADATTDYASYLEQMDEEEEKKEPSPAAANAVPLDTKPESNNLSNAEAAGQAVSEAPENALNETHADDMRDDGKDKYFTETLAKIYIKQGNYEGAIEIMRKLSADNPKKSCYFADQLRFLEKVVINNNKQK